MSGKIYYQRNREVILNGANEYYENQKISIENYQKKKNL